MVTLIRIQSKHLTDRLLDIKLSELIDRCKSGEMTAFQLIYEQYSQAMYHTSLRIINCSTDAEDVLQESFLTAFNSLENLKDHRAFPGWLKRIVINKSLSFLKREKTTWVELEHNYPGVQPEEILDEEVYQFRLDAVRFELGQLPENQRIVISLHVFEDLGFEEIGKLLDMPSATARSHYARGRQKISNKINQLFYGGSF
jgi:RNA polymerase sigma factor (sigma-70 family)